MLAIQILTLKSGRKRKRTVTCIRSQDLEAMLSSSTFQSRMERRSESNS